MAWINPPVAAQQLGYGSLGLRSDMGAEGNPLTSVRREMVPMTLAADRFIKEKKYREALAKLREADVVAEGLLTDPRQAETALR